VAFWRLSKSPWLPDLAVVRDDPRVANSLRVARVYEHPGPEDGTRVLVDRLWPRGLSKAAAAVDIWCREVAPSNELRAWYGHDPARFAEFTERYRSELADAEHAKALAELRKCCADGTVTLLTATKQVDISQATVLAQVLSERRGVLLRTQYPL